MRIFYIFDRFPHHSSYSGYDIFTRHLPLQRSYYRKKFFFHLLQKAISKKALSKIPEIGLDWYKETSFLSELDLLPKISFYRNTLFHFLYGENSYRFFGYNRLRRNNKVAVSFHQPPDIFKTIFKTNKYFKGIDAVFIVGSTQKETLDALMGRERVFLCPHGVDTEFFRPAKDRLFGKEVFRCLSVGWWQRDTQMLKEVIEIINKEQKFKVTFDIVTFDCFFDFFKGLKNVSLHSDIPDEALLKKYQQADILLLPLKDCTTNNAVLEAISCGLPVVSTQAGSLADYVNADCSILVKKKDARGMADEIYSLFADKPRISRMSSSARKRAEEFDYRNLAPLYVDAYEKIRLM
jgi:glycosyltransferase involved in cell wall biosynthesis